MKPVARSVPFVVITITAVVAMAAIGAIPLFGGPGYESALAAGLILPALVAIGTSLAVSAERPTPWAGFVRGIETAIVVSALAYLTTLLHGARVGFCDAADGTLLFVLGPFCGTLLAGTWGGLCGEAAGRLSSRRWRRLVAVLLALSAPAIGVVVSLWRFYSSPMVFAFDPFFGFFSGAVYDTVISDAIGRLLTYRAGSAATLLAAGAAASMFRRDEDGLLQFVPHRHPGVAWFVVAAAAASSILSAEGARLGHWQTSSTIEEQLGGRLIDERCEIVYPRSVPPDAARLLLRDCAAQSRQVSAWLDVPSPPRVRVYFFADARQKRDLMGASNTAIAKPWRNEVYLRLDSYPHPVMGHEIAHVVAGAFADGPFRVGGTFRGLWPNPGLIEGVAVAASPDDELLTPEQWSAAMLQIGVLPRLSAVFALGFLGQNSDTSYTAAGAFVMWLRARHGAMAIARWYSGEPIEVVAGAPLDALETQWKMDLQKMVLTPQALDVAKAKFDRPGVFGRRCPHAIDNLNAKARALVSEGDCSAASQLYREVAALDSHDAPSRFGLASCLPRLGAVTDARAAWSTLANDPSLPEAKRNRARESLADLDLLEGQVEPAQRAYQQLLDKGFDEDQLRTLDVKMRAARNPSESRPITELLMGTMERAPDQRLAYALLGKWMADMPSDGLPAYLVGRNLAGSGLWAEAAEYLDWAIQRRLPEERVLREALRIRIIVACAQRDEQTARRSYARWRAMPGVPEIRWQVLERRLGACIAQKQ